MTTVAWDGKTLAADTAMTYSGMKWRYPHKIRRFASGCVAGMAGDLSAGLKLLDWLESDDLEAELDAVSDEDGASADAILITPDGEVTLYDSSGAYVYIDEPYAAIGSGAHLAMGMLTAGRSAVDAVKLAIERDPGSGFDVISYVLGT